MFKLWGKPTESKSIHPSFSIHQPNPTWLPVARAVSHVASGPAVTQEWTADKV